EVPAGSIIDEAMHIDIPPEGFETIGEALPVLIPENVPAGEASDSGGSGGCFFEYAYNVQNLWVSIMSEETRLVPQDGYLTLESEVFVTINDQNDPFGLDLSAVCLDSECTGYVLPFPVTLQARVDLNLADADGDGVNDLDATIGDLVLTDGFSGDFVILECTLGQVLGALNSLGVDIYGFILNAVFPILEGELNEQIPTLEAEIEESFASVNINEEFEVGDARLSFSLQPQELTIVPEGMRLAFQGSTDIDNQASCIADYDTGGSKETSGTPSAVGDFPVAGDIGILVSDEFVNQALYSIWRGGLLCQTIDEETFALDTSILNLLTGDAFQEFFPETKPMVLSIDPQAEPTLQMNTTHDLSADISQLKLNFVTEVDFRQSQVLSVDLQANVGIDFPFDASTGLLTGDIALDPSQMTPTVDINEFLPGQNENLESSLSSQLGTVLNLVDLESLTGDLEFNLPAINGLGLTQIEMEGTGSAGEDFGLFASLGEVPYEGGCGAGEDAESGCSVQKTPRGKLLLAFVLLLVGYMRRTR
ncbi:MAG: hypothetical protein VX278_12530, partial [Myxococcota bacterium]|nr:hypothetical protein [Myxococcota bacterium]